MVFKNWARNIFRRTRWISLFLSILIIAGCASMQRYRLSQSAEIYLQKSAQSQGIEKQRYQLMAVNQLLINGNLVDAQQLLGELDQIPLDPNIAQQKIILEAKLALKKDDPKWAYALPANASSRQCRSWSSRCPAGRG